MYGVGAELAQAMNELCFDDLDGPVARLHTAPVTHPFAPVLERAMLVSTEAIVARRAARACAGHADPIARARRRRSACRADARAAGSAPANAPHACIGRSHAAPRPRAPAVDGEADHDAVRRSHGQRRAASCKWHRRLGRSRLPRANTSPTSRQTRRSSRSNRRRTACSPKILADEGAVVPMGASIGVVREGWLMRIAAVAFRSSRRRARARGARAARRNSFAQNGPVGAWQPLPPDVRAAADGIIHFPPNTTVDGDPGRVSERCAASCARGVGFDNIDLAAWGGRGVAGVQRARLRHVRGRRPRHCADAGPRARHARPIMTPCGPDPAAGWRHAAAPVGAAACATRCSASSASAASGLRRRTAPAASACGSRSTIPTSRSAWRSRSARSAARASRA